MTRPALRSRRALAALGVLAVVSFSGCVYLRLLELKRQFSQFDRFFSLQTETGLRLTCLKPVLLTDDVRWLGIKPESAKRTGQAELWQVRWVKQPPPGPKEAGTYDIVVELAFAQDRLARVAIPERYFAFIPKSFLVDLIRSLGGAHVDKSGRRIDAIVTPEEVRAARPSLPTLDRLLGRPSEEHTEGRESVLRYVYVPATPESGAGVFEMILYFDTASGELLRWDGRTPIGRIGFDFAPTAPAGAQK
jgi:hypothetical protein